MGQKLREDKIPTLTQNAGTITMPSGARLTIGGQQYVTNSALNVVVNVSSANTRYQIYAVLNSGVVQLVISDNENSSGPAGYTAWKLVGSYYTTNLLGPSSFGAFVKIKGTPISGTFRVKASYNNEASLTIDDFLEIQRIGDRLVMNYSMSTSSTDASTAVLSINSPFGGNGFAAGPAGSYTIFDFSNNNVHLASEAQVTNSPGTISFINPQTTGSISPSVFTTTSYIRATMNCRLIDWDNTPIEDL